MRKILLYLALCLGFLGASDLKSCYEMYKIEKENAKITDIDAKKEKSIVELTIHEGRNHQIKKMFESLGYRVSKLKREKYANMDLTGLKTG